MPAVPMRAGEVWERNEIVKADDPWNRIRVVGQFGDEVTITPADAFGEVIPATPASLAQNYRCVEGPSALPAAPDDAAVAELANGGGWGHRDNPVE